MNTSLNTFMKIAISAVCISAFIYGGIHLAISEHADTVANYITKSGGGE